MTLVYDQRPDLIGFYADRLAPPPFSITGWCGQVGDKLVLQEVNLRAVAGVNASMLRRVKVAELLSEFRTRLLEMDGRAWVPVDPEAARLQEDRTRREVARNTELARLADGSSPSRGGRRGYPDEHYRRIALSYLELVNNQRLTRGVLARMAADENRPEQTIRTWIHKARVRGFLTGASVGKAGAMPGPRLYPTGGDR